MTCWLYTITNKINNKVYVGKTNDFNRRKSQHRNTLRKNTHKNPHLQKSWNKYGEENFVFEKLEEYDDDFIYSMENYWCNLLDSFNYHKGYNEKPTHPFNRGGNSLQTIEKVKKALTGRKHSIESILKMSNARKGTTIPIETRLKMSNSAKGKKKSEETKKKMSIHRYNNPLTPFLGKKIPKEILDERANSRKIPIIQYSLDMEFIKEWKSAVDIFNETGISRGNIASCCKLKRKNSAGFIWRHKNIN